MTTVVVDSTATLTASLADIHTTAASRLDTVRVFVSNDGDSTTWKLTYNGVVMVPDETLGSPGSGVSKPLTMAAGSVLQASSPGTAVTVLVNGISQEL